MTRAAVEEQIANFEQIGRQRALTDGESRQLQKLITVERRYGTRARAQPEPVERSGRPYTVAARDGIIPRIDATLALLARAGRRVRAIYLNADDFAAADQSGQLVTGSVRTRGGAMVQQPTYAGHAVREAKSNSSIVYDSNGLPSVIRKRVSRPS